MGEVFIEKQTAITNWTTWENGTYPVGIYNNNIKTNVGKIDWRHRMATMQYNKFLIRRTGIHIRKN